MRVKFELKVRCANTGVAEKLESVLQPDNRSVPEDQRFTVVPSGRTLTFRVESARPFSALSSVESLLGDTHLFKEVWLLSSKS